MRRAAGRAPTHSIPRTKLKQVARDTASHLLTQVVPSAPAYQPRLLWPVSGRAFPAQAVAESTSWPTKRGESLWKTQPKASKERDDTPGQKGHRQAESAFVLGRNNTETRKKESGKRRTVLRAKGERRSLQGEVKGTAERLAKPRSRPGHASSESNAAIGWSIGQGPEPLSTHDAKSAAHAFVSEMKRATKGSRTAGPSFNVLGHPVFSSDLPNAVGAPPKQSGDEDAPAWDGFSWKPEIRDDFRSRGTAEIDPRSPGPGDTRQDSWQPGQQSGLIADIWTQMPDPPIAQRPSGSQQNVVEKTGETRAQLRASDDPQETELLPELEKQARSISEWEHLAESMQQNHGGAAAWAAMIPLTKEYTRLLAHPDAVQLRDVFLGAAIGDDVRLNEFTKVAKGLRDISAFDWPDLYGNVIYRLLDEAEPSRAVFWHSRLYHLFPPSQAVFTALLSHFAVDPSPEMQRTLMKLYETSKGVRLYDSIIPRLFDFGQSRSARHWRQKLVAVRDFPSSEASTPFLQFLAAYYPLLELSREERRILRSKGKAPTVVNTRTEAELKEIKKSIHGDHIVAKWFASAWTTVSFAVDLVHRFGVSTLGPLALQSLGLRDPGAQNLAANLAQLEELGVSLAPTTYCRIVAYLAKEGNDELLRGLLSCDVHPDEFEDLETVRMLSDAAEERRDVSQQRLMEGVEAVMLTLSSQDGAHHTDSTELQSPLTTTQGNTAEMLDISFENIGYHPLSWLKYSESKRDEKLIVAVEALHKAFADDVPIPLDYWKRLMFSLGRLGLFEQLEKLSMALSSMYAASNRRRIPVHPMDVPRTESEGPETRKPAHQVDGLEQWQEALKGRATGAHDIYYIPTDLPFSHRHHPLQKIFHQRLQRNIIRWGFDRALRVRQKVRGIAWWRHGRTKSASRGTHISEQGIGQGLRILAKLRDAGVLIDEQVIQSEIIRRLVAANLPERRRAPWMDHHELETTSIVRLVNRIWGRGIFNDSDDLESLVRSRRAKIQQHYWNN